ncbi:MAG: hypothetical protein ACFB21_00025 [Opitutales bacterium]
MDNPAPTAGNNPFQEVCIYFSQQGNDLAVADLIKRFGFTVYAFLSLPRLQKHLEQNPLTAATFVQGSLETLEPRVRQSYHGPIYALPAEREAMLSVLGENLREVHRNQMKVQDPKVIRVLKALDAFTHGNQKTLLLLGPESALERALEFIRIFYPRGLREVGETLPEEVPEDGTYVTRNLFEKDLTWQQRWNVLYGTAEFPHLILQPGSMDELDALYLRGSVDEMLYERLSFRQTDVASLQDYSLEELAVQPLQKSDPRLIFDAEGDTPEVAVISSAKGAGKKEKSSRGLLGRFLKR